MPTPNCCKKYRLVLSKVKTDILVWLRAGDARLRHFEQGIANAVSITDTDLIIGKSFDREILGKLAEVEIMACKKLPQ